ncbi:MAG: glycosyltransferase [Bacteroidales bacterium]|nr:glycosyltransferase [Bacteroidales bacterium]MDE7072652.1 glycosyltransferase [Bacteroidales bacterium]
MSVNKDKQRREVVVSLTSFPAAISYATGAVKSVLAGSVLPDKVVLYLTFSQFDSEGIPIPEALTELAKGNPLFEIRNYDPDIRSYRKLVPALRDFPEAVIVTVDDDVDYHPHMLRDLLRLHERFPEAIIAHRAKRVLAEKPYRKWPKFRWYHFFPKKIQLGFDCIQTGCAGVLYPPHSLKKEMMEVALFTQLAPTADDFWFWAAAVVNGTKILPVPFGPHNKPRGLGKPRELSLKTVNFKAGKDRNDAAFHAILDKYPLIRQRIDDGK